MTFVYFFTPFPLTAQKMKFSIMDFFIKCDEIRSFLRIWSHLLKKSFMENFIFYAVTTHLSENVGITMLFLLRHVVSNHTFF